MKNDNEKKRSVVVSKAIDVKKKNARRLKNKANVTGVGVGYKIKEGKRTKQIAIRVYVSKKLPLNKLAARDILPKTIGGIPVDVIEAKFELQQDPTVPANHRLRFNPMLGGISIGKAARIGSGTLGSSVFDNDLGEDMILSNWHVLCASLTCSVGDGIIQPGSGGGDTGTASDIVGSLYRSALTNRVDAAIARLTGHRFLLKQQFGFDTVIDVAAPALGMRVRKSGRTTGLTTAEITDISADVTIAYPHGDHSLVDQVIIENDTLVSQRGDSGSIWIDDSNNAVALLFAGSGSRRSIANPMPVVLSTLNINFRFGITMHDFVAITANTLL